MGDDIKVKVAVRVRPINKRELELNTYCCVDMRNHETILTNREERKGRKKFTYDHCFWSIDANDERFAGQEMVFDALGKGVLESSFHGYNACIFAYGQTGSGKSYTMMGASQDEKLKGIIPRLCDSMFAKIAENKDSRLTYKVEVSYMEIYCERVRDLLCGKETKHNLKVREHKTLGPYVEGLSKMAVRSFWDIESIMLEGNKSRTVAATQMNAESSRSHAVFSIVLTQTLFDPETNAGNEKVSRIGLVDLAGSERAGKTGALGDRLKEGSNINKSLHTLGLVISALAEISAGKKTRGSHVPYRDSTLTWLLKDSLGGNSKTVMIATVSPASDNYEETLSTLRYADRAKKIVNHAVINEDPNSKVIRELREEVEKLRQLLKDQGGPSGTAANPADSQDIVTLREKLSISENLMQEMSKTWEQKLVESEKLHQERQKALEDMGISVKSAGIGVQQDKFYFVNLNADPIMSELLVCYLKPHTKIGRPDAEVQQDIQLKGLGIQPEHCVVEVVDPEVFITPLPAARTLVNGKIITEKTKLCHGYRVLLGNNHFFRLSCPKRKVVKSAAGTKVVAAGTKVVAGGTRTAEGHEQHSTAALSPQDEEVLEDNEIDPDEEMEIDETAMNYDFAMKEVILNELNSDPNSVYQQMKKSMEQQHFHEKQDALEQQKVHYERQLAELRDQLQDDIGGSPTTSPPSGTLRSRNRPFFSPMLEAQWEAENRKRVMDTYFRANTLVREANMLSQALEKDTQLKVTMQIPPSLLSPILMSEGGYNQTGGNEIAVRVLQRARGTDSVWDMETLEEKVVAMRELFQMQDDGKCPTDDDTTMDPFFDIEQHVLLGVANIFTQCLYHRICHKYDAPIIGPTGKVCGSMKMSLERIQVEDVDGDDDADGGAGSGWQVLKDPDGELVVGSQIEVKVHVMEATGLPSAYCHFVFAQYKFWGQSEPVTLAPLQAFSPAFGKSDKLLEGELKFDHTQVFTVEVTEDFLDYLDNGTLSVEVYGHRRTGFTTTEHIVDEDGQNKSFPERCCEVMKNLEMWVGILELNDQGSYVPVSIEERKDVKTGGVYVIRQGQSRRIEVKVAPVSGSGNSPLQCSHIKSVAIGSIYVRKRTDEPLDSYQDIDLDRLRGKWADALMRRRDYLDKELRKIMEKKGRTKVDNEKEQELIDQWTMLLMERSALLQPKPGSGVPGAPTRWKMSPGMEPRVTTLYLDLNDDMLTPCDDEDPMAAIATAPLLGEKDESMINLVLQKSGETVPEATASWDSSVHDAPGLNCPTANIDRVYAILRVSVMLHHPPGIELVLRKRVCLRVIKKVGFGTSLMKFFSSGPSHTETGAMYEVVTGIPKLEGMFRPPKIPSLHPSFVEVEENENVVEKFKEGMMSVRNILALDRLKQEVCLKEKLVKAGQLPRHHTTTVDNSNQSEDTTATPPPQEEFPNPTIYEESEGVSPNLRVLQNSPQYSSSSGTEEHRPIISPLLIPDINVTAGTPPLTIGDIGAIVRQNEITDVSTANNPGGEDVDEEPLGDMIGLSEVTVNNITEQQNNVQGHSVKRQGSERKSRPNRVGNSAKRRSKSSERLPSSDRSLPSREGFTPTSERLTRRSIDTITPLLPGGRRNTTRDKSPERRDKSPERRGKSPERRNRTADKPPLSNDTSSDSDDASSSAPHKSAASSLKSSASSLSSAVATAEANNQPSCTVGEKVMVDTPIGFKFGKVKFVGSTEFAAGEWIGVALERQSGKHDGTVKGVKYFRCKDKHGIFVRPDKIIRDPAITGIPNQNPKPLGSPARQQKGVSSSPSTKRKVSNTKI